MEAVNRGDATSDHPTTSVPTSGHTRTDWATQAGIVGILLGTAVVVFLQRSTIAKGIDGLPRSNWAWFAAASAAELGSMLAMAMLYRTFLMAGGSRVSIRWIFSTIHTANLVSAFVPVIGAGLAGRQAYLQLREVDADPAAASLTLTLSGIESTVTFVAIPLTSGLLSGQISASMGALVTTAALLIGLAVVTGSMRSVRGRARLARSIASALRFVQRCTRRPRADADVLAGKSLAWIQGIRLTRYDVARSVVWSLLNWCLDIAALAFALRAAGIDNVPFAGLLVVWVAVVGVGSLSPTPAGIGAVEVVMAAALGTLGIRGPNVITAILVYRVISLKLAGTAWAFLYRYIHRHRRAPTPSGWPV